MRGRGLAVAAALLLAGCETQTPEERAMQEAIDKARERNAWIGAALVMLLTLAVRHAIRATAAGRAARRVARGLPPPHAATYTRHPSRWLVVSAAVTEVITDLVLVGGGSLLGWALGPVPYSDQGMAAIGFVVVVIFVVPVMLALVVVALLVQGVAARLPHVSTPALRFLALPHAGLIALGVNGLIDGETDGRWFALVPVVAGVLGGYGFLHEARIRRRERVRALRPYG